MQNPWENLKKVRDAYIAPCDTDKIAEYQRGLRGAHRLQLGGIPGPYTGDPARAVVYVLALNPGHVGGEEDIYRKHKQYLMRNLTHENKAWPFVSFDPVFRDTPGGQWWAKKLNQLIQKTDVETVARFVFNAEYFPYHSEKYRPRSIILPSQNYTFFLVKKAIKDKKLIVIMRSRDEWYNAVPELRNYKNKTVLRNYRNITVSRGNMDEKFFEKIVAALRNAANKDGQQRRI